MLDTFIMLAEAARKIGKVTAASLYPSGLIAIDGVDKNGRPFSLSYNNREIKEYPDENS